MLEAKRLFLWLIVSFFLAVTMPGLSNASTTHATVAAEQNAQILLPSRPNSGVITVAQCTSAAEECQEEKAKKKKQKKKRVRRGSFHYDK